MNKIVALLLLVGVLTAQNTVTTVPSTKYWTSVYSGTLSGMDTTSAMQIYWFTGVLTMAIETDTTGASVNAANQSDSCLTIGYQLYCGQSNIQSWGPYYNNIDTWTSVTNYTKIDTVDRAYVNTGESVFFIDLQNEADQLCWADSVRFFIGIGATDSLKVNVSIGGQ